MMRDNGNPERTPAEREELAKRADTVGDAMMFRFCTEGGFTQGELERWLRCRAWARKLRGLSQFTAEMATAELVGAGLPL